MASTNRGKWAEGVFGNWLTPHTSRDTNLILTTKHTVQSLSNSDTNINLVHSKFLVPYFQLFKMTIKLLPATSEPLHAQTMAVLIDIYYDLTYQDLAPEFEDRHEMCFAEETGYFMQLMAWDPPQLQTDVRRCLASA